MNILSDLRKRSGFATLDGRFSRFLLVDFLYNAAGALSGFFFNIFLLRATQDVNAIARFNILQHASIAVFMIGAVWMARRVSVLSAQRIGFAVQCAAYTMLAIFARAETAVPAAAMLGAAGACYYISYSPMLLAYSNNANRDPALGALNLVNTLIGLLTPVATGFLISAFPDLTGYRVLFCASAAVSLFCVYRSFRLDPIRLEGHRTRFADTLRTMAHSKTSRSVMFATFAYASRTALFTYFGSLLGYKALGSEGAMGIVGLITGCVALAASVAYGKTVKQGSRFRAMIYAAGVLSVGVSLIILRLNVWTWIPYAIIAASTAVFIDAPPLAAHLAVVEGSDTLSACTPEVTAIREFVYAAGYAASFLPVFIIRDAASHAPVILLATAVFQILPALCIRSTER
ncbi:hypothetical protein FACS1894184_13110 [Clostridia bacterium]|nr:hypothetical protein FACS1894184_13110 [Clostridia bacterium]